MDLGNPIATGNTADIYLHDGRIIKLFKDSMPEKEAAFEAKKQRYAYSHGLPVPFVFDVTVIGNRQAIVMEYAAGKTIGALLFNNTSASEHFMKLTIDVQMRIHGVKAEGIELMAVKLKRQLSQASALNDNQKEILLRELRSMRFDIRLCHGDFHMFNLIETESDIVIIDWVDASAGDVKADVCRSYLLYSQVSMDLAKIYLRLYCQQSGLLPDDVLKWEPILAGARLSENVTTESQDRLVEIVTRFTGA